MARTPGYSGKPLYQKLGLKPGHRCMPLNAPDNYEALLNGAEGITYVSPPGPADTVHLFCANHAVLDAQALVALTYVDTGGMLWIPCPKNPPTCLSISPKATFATLCSKPTGSTSRSAPWTRIGLD